MWPFGKDKSEHRASDYSAALSRAFEDLAGATQPDASTTAAAAFAIGTISRAFAVAEIDGVDLDANVMASIGKTLVLRGNAVYDVRADPVGGLTLIPSPSWDIFGPADPAAWNYRLSLNGPSTMTDVERSGADVLHFRINALPESPWAGRSPLVAAGFSARLLAMVELRMSEEAGARVGTLLGTPPLSADSNAALRADLKMLGGGVALVEHGGGNFGRQAQGGNQVDWRASRLGSNFPEGNVALRRDVSSDVISAFGVPHALYAGSEGGNAREAWRVFGIAMDAYGAIVAAELTAKLERPIVVSFKRLASIDIAARARAVGVLATAGVPLDAALEAADLE